MEETVQENEGLKEQLEVMKQEAGELAHSRQRIRLLEANGHFAHHAQVKLQHQLNSTEHQLKDRSEQRSQLEQEVVGAKTQIADLANGAGLDLSNGILIERLTTELQGVMPLKVWAGHPCSACKNPTSGTVSQDVAKTLLRDFGHATCLEQQKSNVGKWILGGAAAVYGISRLR